MVVGQAFPNEFFASIRDSWLSREEHLLGVEDSLVSHDSHLSLVVTEWLYSEQQLVENNSHAPNVNLNRESYNFKIYSYLLGDLWLSYIQFKAFGSLVPVSPYSLGSQLYLLIVLSHQFTQAKVSYFDFSLVENDILRLQIIVNYFLFLISEILQST